MKSGMKTIARAVGLVAIASILVSCNTSDYSYPTASWKDGIIVNVGNKDYTYADIYNLMNGKKDSAKAYYSTAENVLLQFVTPRTDAILAQADLKITAAEESWKTSAKTNKTSYKEEMEKALKSEQCETEDDLRDKYIVQIQTTQNSNDYYAEVAGTTDTNSKFYISEAETKNWVSTYAPYHVSHILVKVDAAGDGAGTWKGEISSDDAKQIGNVASALGSANTFGSSALSLSDDTGSAANYGELYTASTSVAMTTSTSYINEFKLGVYAYDSYLSPDTKANTTLKNTLRDPSTIATSTVNDSIGDTEIGKGKAYGIPFSAALSLKYEADQVKSDTGLTVKDATADQYPRNIIFNSYFNNHSVSFMYNDAATYDAAFITTCQAIVPTVASIDDIRNSSALSERYKEYLSVKAGLNGLDSAKFKSVSGVSDNLITLAADSGKSEVSPIASSKNILCDEKGNPVIIVRGGSGSGDGSYQGIHFIVVNKDPFVNADTAYNYWRVNMPDTDSTIAANTTNYSTNPGFVNFVRGDVNSNDIYQKRIDAIKAQMKASDSNIDFKLWEWNLAKYKAKYNEDFETLLGANVSGQINTYITFTRQATATTASDSLDASWVTYIQALNLEQENVKRITPTVCVSYFQSGSFTDAQEELCNVK